MPPKSCQWRKTTQVDAGVGENGAWSRTGEMDAKEGGVARRRKIEIPIASSNMKLFKCSHNI